jgi:GTP-binding protein EngB required for normal cell division
MVEMREEYLVFTGRPNAGKSSIIKKMVGLDLATGKHPGTTRQISKYPLSHNLFLVDMPGFGTMMRASKRSEEEMKRRIVQFLESIAQKIALAVHVLDISTFLEVTWRLEKKGFISLDVEMVQFLAEISDKSPLIAANKVDKANREEINANLQGLMEQISNGDPLDVAGYIFPVSVKTGEGLSDLEKAIRERLIKEGHENPLKTYRSSSTGSG